MGQSFRKDIEELIEDKIKKEKEKLIHHWEEEGIKSGESTLGTSNIIKGKTKIELDKSVDATK